jgi:hypothetical protein
LRRYEAHSATTKQQHFTMSRHASPRGGFLFYALFENARVPVVLYHVALTDLTHFRIFPRNLAPSI